MFNLWKKRIDEQIKNNENTVELTDEQAAAFFKADKEAEEKAGLTGKLGTYTFTCPNCGSECTGNWVRFDSLGNRHGHTGCQTCNIHLMV
ncbi:MAG: hypothetical protein IKI97_08490 [Clostridia bacterium]|nr:hypothetical protein [Clostridia bacterium]